ncbi:MAG: GNAT family N-acetyltransferase [Alphaproteobacteria bacterium]|nr:GNAT family N-acetyltransferase [Alphaproteobacteria bacterium]
MSARVRPATPEDLPAIVELMEASLGDGMPRKPEFYLWKHHHNPFGSSLVLLAEDDEGLVGLRAMMRWRFRLGDQLIDAVRPVDTATHPRFQRRGLFTRLTHEVLGVLAENGVRLVFNTPNDKSRPGYLKMGWQTVGVMPLWVRPGGRFAVRGGRAREGGVKLVTPRDDRLQTDRVAGYLDWRYRQAPDLTYRVLGDGDVGVIVRDRDRGGRNELTVVDVAAPTRASVPLAASVLRRAVRGSSSDYALAMAAPGTREAAVLALAGFVPAGRRGPHLVARAVEGAVPLSQAFDPRNWRMQIGDLEVF